MLRRSGACLVILLSAAACSRNPRPAVAPARAAAASSTAVETTFTVNEAIAEVKDFLVSLGSHATDNFVQHSDRIISDNRCYFTGKLQLPEFYSSLSMVREDGERCAARSNEHDVFFYPVQAVASGEEVVTVSLAEASPERVLVVVPHEDFHNQSEALQAPTEVAEAAATLVGFLTASGYAHQRFGAESPMARGLARDADLFLRKSLIVNQYYEKVDGLYRDFRSGTLTEEQTIERKHGLFDELLESCSAIAPDPVSFNKCPAAMNNAGLAFDRTYTAHYPMLHDLYTLLGSDATELVSTLKRLMADWPGTAATASELFSPH
jgi:hypothetical protein